MNYRIAWLGIICVLAGCDSLAPIETSSADKSKKSGASSSDEGSSIAHKEIAATPSRGESEEKLGSTKQGSLVSNHKPELRFLRAPKVEELALPDLRGSQAIWGATGRDRVGRMYFGIASYGVDDPSAYLLRLDPRSDRFEVLGEVNQELDKLKIRRQNPWPETQMKIHSKIMPASDGRVYFSTQDEHNEASDGSTNALFGGRLFGFQPDKKIWDCLLTTPESLIALAARDDLVVAQGYFGHVLYQYNVKTKKINKKELGTYKGHVSRNIFMDHRGHVYGIRARLASSQEAEGVYKLNGDRVRISLTELDTQLREIHDWPLSDYEPSGDTGSHGITGFSEMLDGSIVFVTHSGALWRVRMDGRDSQLERLGWLNPLGKSYCASLFCPYGDRYVCGFVPQNGQFFWSVFDIRLSRSVLLPFDDASQKILTQKGLLVYGCETLDDNSNAYVVGWKVIERGNGPFIFRLRWE